MSITKLKTYDERNSSFELMRMILMFMIVVHHGIVHGLRLSELGLGDNAQWHINMLASELIYDNLWFINYDNVLSSNSQ